MYFCGYSIKNALIYLLQQKSVKETWKINLNNLDIILMKKWIIMSVSIYKYFIFYFT